MKRDIVDSLLVFKIDIVKWKHSSHQMYDFNYIFLKYIFDHTLKGFQFLFQLLYCNVFIVFQAYWPVSVR